MLVEVFSPKMAGALFGSILLVFPLVALAGNQRQDETATSAQSQATPQSSTSERVKPNITENAKTPTVKTIESVEKLAWAMLVAGINDEKVQKRTEAITALGAVGPQPRAVRLIEDALLKDTDSYVREVAATTLGKMKARHSIPRLRNALDDNAPEVVFAAARSLWELGDRSGRDIFVEVLDGERKTSDGVLKSNLRDARRKFSSPGGLVLMGAREAAGALFGPLSYGFMAAEEFSKGKDKGASARTIAASLLATDPSAEAARELDDALQDKNWTVRAAAAEALGRLPRQGQLSQLAPLLDDDKEAVRFMAASSIVRLSQVDRKPRVAPTDSVPVLAVR
jgi:HEAT repeat protein